MLDSLWNMLVDFVKFIFGKILDFFLYLLNLIPFPEFVSNGLNDTFNLMPDSLVYISSRLSFPEALAIFGIGVTFKITRKFLTLFQW